MVIGKFGNKNEVLRGGNMSNLFGKDWDLTEAVRILEKSSKSIDYYLDDKRDAMIKASINAALTKRELLDIYVEKGLIGVYDLGMKHMYEYLKR